MEMTVMISWLVSWFTGREGQSSWFEGRSHSLEVSWGVFLTCWWVVSSMGFDQCGELVVSRRLTVGVQLYGAGK